MKLKGVLAISALTLLATLCVYAQNVAVVEEGPVITTADVPFTFSAAGKTYPAGQYSFEVAESGAQIITIRSTKGKISGLALVLTRASSALHTTPADSHVVFDKLGDRYMLAELWIPGLDGYVLNMLQEKHEHRVLDVPVKKAMPAKSGKPAR